MGWSIFPRSFVHPRYFPLEPRRSLNEMNPIPLYQDIRVNHVGFKARGRRPRLSLAGVNSLMETRVKRQLTYESALFVSYLGPPILEIDRPRIKR